METQFDPYANIADLYDLEHDDFADDVPFYLNSIMAVGDPVLEFGCGSGRLLRPIAAAGYRVTGLDQSTTMLDRARSRIGSAKAKRLITLHQGSMTGSGPLPGGPFGVAIFSLNGLMHLTEPREQLAALRAARSALDPRGQLLIDVLHATPDTLRSYEIGVVHEGAWQRDDGSRVDKFSARRISAAEQLIDTQLWYDLVDPEGNLRRVSTSFDLRYLHRNELELMLELAGFAEWQVYGGYDLEPFTDQSERLIIAAEATSSG